MQVPAQVEYERAASVGQALSLLARYAPAARILAGGHSLIPMMKLRLAQPEVLIDINGIRGLRYIERSGDQLRIGALARHADLLARRVAGEHFAILHDAERVIADPIVRNWGTIGGSLCQADPSEDLSAAFAALKGSMIIHGPDGSREVSAQGLPHRPVRDGRRPGRDADRDQAADQAGQRQRVPEGVPPGGRLADRRRRGGGLAGRRADRRRRHRADGGRRGALRRGRGRGVPARPAGRRGGLRAGGRDRGGALPPGRGPARARPSTSGTWSASSPRGCCGWPCSGRFLSRSRPREDHRHRQRDRLRAGRRAAAAADPLPARRPGADRLALGLRHVQLRRLRGVAGRDAGQVLHGARRHGRRAAGHHRRGPGDRRGGSTRSRRPSRPATGCSAASARRA